MVSVHGTSMPYRCAFSEPGSKLVSPAYIGGGGSPMMPGGGDDGMDGYGSNMGGGPGGMPPFPGMNGGPYGQGSDV